MSNRSSIKWSDVKKALAALDKAACLGLLQELFKLSPQNRAFFAARFGSGAGEDLLGPFRKRMREPFYPRRGGFGSLKMDDARSAVREYEKATGDLRGTVDLMLDFVEAGSEFTHEFGDIDAAFYDSLTGMLNRAIDRLRSPEGWRLVPEMHDRLVHVAKAVGDIGWGFSDHVKGEIQCLLEDYAARPGGGAA